MTLQIVGVYAAGICLLIGGLFALVGAVGLLKFNDPMNRLHAPTKVGTMGVGALLAASMILAFIERDGSFHELLIMAFLFVTAPISANFMAKVNIHRRTCETPPETGEDCTWSTLNPPPEDEHAAAPDATAEMKGKAPAG